MPENAALEIRVDTLEAILGEFIVHSRISFSKLSNEVSRLSTEMISFKDEMKDFKDEMKDFKDQMLSFKDDMKDFKDEMKDFKDQMLGFKDDMKDVKDEMKDFKDQMLSFKDDMKDFKDEMKDFKDQMLGFKDDMKDFKDEMKDFKDQMLGFKDDMKDFKDEMKDFKDEMKDFKDQMLGFKDDMKDFKDEMKDFKDEMKDFKDEMLDFKDDVKDFKLQSQIEHRKINREWGNLARKMGTVVEDLIVPAVRPVIRRYFTEEVDYLAVNVRKRSKALNLKGEFDVLAAGETRFFLVEVKSTPRESYLDDFLNNIERFKILFPEFGHMALVPIFGSIRFEEDFIPLATQRGIYLMAYREWDYMDILNFDEVSKSSNQ